MKNFISFSSFNYGFKKGNWVELCPILQKLKRLNILLCIFLIFLSFLGLTQETFSQTIEWQKCLGGSGYDYANSIQQTTDGGYIVAGSSNSNNKDLSGNQGSYDFWIVKLSSTGTIEWKQCLGGSNVEEANSIQQTSDGGYVVAGYTLSNDGHVSGNHGLSDFWVVKLTSTGAAQWMKCLGGSSADEAYSIQQTTDGGYIVVGRTYSNDGQVSGNHGADDCWIVKLSSMGDLEWEVCLGGTGDEIAYSIQQTIDGGYILAGTTYSNDGNVGGNHGSCDYWVAKLSPTAEIQWQKCLGGSASDEARSIIQTNDGGYLVAGWANSNDGDVTNHHGGISDFWVVKLTPTGAIQWQKCLGGSGIDYGRSILQTNDNGFIVTGSALSNDGDVQGNHGSDDFWVVKLFPSGDIQWQKCLGGSSSDMAFSIKQTSDNKFVVAGHTGSDDYDVKGNRGLTDYWIVKFSPPASFIENEWYMDNIIQIFPNPATSQITIQLIEPILFSSNINVKANELTLYISDFLGKELQSFPINLQEHQFNSLEEIKLDLDISQLSNGVYTILLKNNQNTIIHYNKLIKMQ
ncbi:MAG: T9SS type A sorting domain-containing protein, partial [Ignavibacteria bacterium]|nr:T9SS type A sorting domain-containing protein [Ignavibacteria bacterium]